LIAPDTTATLDSLRWHKFPVLDDGFVCLVDAMGDDSSVVQAARVSYGAGTKTPSDDRTLIRYLMRHRHTTPFEMVEFKFLVRVPMDCWRQWVRHRMASVNEYSTRYSEAIDSRQTTAPDQWRAQSGANKQGSGGNVSEWPEKWRTEDPHEFHTPYGPINTERSAIKSVGGYLTAREETLHEIADVVYRERLEAGVAREQARKDLPLSTYTEAYWKIDLHNLLHFLALRMDSHAQQEIREYATIVGREIVAKLVPYTWEAFEDYRLNAVTFSGGELDILRYVLDSLAARASERSAQIEMNSIRQHLGNQREALEFSERLRRIGVEVLQ
jgi:thymidylate synthase (FAD)